MAKLTERTSFTKDVEGRYLCNDVSEVNAWTSAGGRPFDVIVVGGGTFGSAIAAHGWVRRKKDRGGLRTLVIEAGLFTIPEHVQNTGIQGLTDPSAPFFLNENAPQPEPPRNEIWGIPWNRPSRSRALPTRLAAGRCTGVDGRRACSTRK